MQYTSELKRLVLPEYGRNVQQMVDLCMTIRGQSGTYPLCQYDYKYHGESVSSFTRYRGL